MHFLWITLVFSLAGGVHAESKDCDLPAPLVLDNSTISKLLGKWYYLGGATNNTEYHKDMTQMDNSILYISPLKQTGFSVNEYYYLGDQCAPMVANYSLSDSRNEFIIEGDPDMTMQIITFIPDDFWLVVFRENRMENLYQGIFLNARNKTVSQENFETLKSHAKCLGLTEKETVFFPMKKDECPMGKEDEKKYTQELQKYWDKFPPSDIQEKASPLQI